ncbi:MAG: 50S ribosomal protein L6 [Gammaproteobacteria bacterium]|uniref:Large ribosomal subunit protein uL6 n=1 Tax=Candidatus Thiopontia autotrophica TaxID=2841688 RepID=A0A8J6PB54_9GAMM|nr:50S ribosomal protein L6 [Candidatus Thiopontia autotrophica]MBL6969099.1 50S ribosomal protein L6 [Gammaproteobacteria bacterium]
MSRIANAPVEIPTGVDVTVSGQKIQVKGANGSFDYDVHETVNVAHEDNVVRVSAKGGKECVAMAGTMRALINNMVVGVSAGFEKKLTLIGVGYRAKAAGKKLELTLGFSHPVNYAIPEGITIETPAATEVVVKGADKQKVGQVAAEIRAFRPPEPYKGKGVRYTDEHVIRKEAKKK